MCKKLMRHKELFQKNFMELMSGMKDDKVVNVKLLLAEVILEHIEEKGPLCEDEALLALQNSLKEDENEEVREVFDV